MANTIIGTIVHIGQTVSMATKSGVPFQKRELVLSVQRYDPNTGQPFSDKSNTPMLTFIGEKCSELDRYQVGQAVTVSFDLSGRTYTDREGQTKYINDVRGYKIEPYGLRTPTYPQPTQAYNQQAYQQPAQAYPQPVYPQQGYGTQQQYATAPQASQPKDDGLPF